MRQRLDGAELDQPAAPGLPFEVPELVEADLAPVGIAGEIDVQVAQRLADHVPVILSLLQRLEVPVGHLQVVMVPRGFIRPRRLRGGSHVTPGKEVRERRMLLPVPQDRRHPARIAEKGVLLQRRPAEEQVIAAARSQFARRRGFERAQPGVLRAGVQGLQPPRVLLHRRARRQIDLEHARVRRERELRPEPLGVLRDVSFKAEQPRLRHADRRRHDLQQFDKGRLQQRREKERHLAPVFLEHHRPLERPFRQQVQRQPQPGRPFRADQLQLLALSAATGA